LIFGLWPTHATGPFEVLELSEVIGVVDWRDVEPAWDVSPGFEGVTEEFRRSIRVPGSEGAAVSIYVDGRPVLNAWAGTADPAAGRAYAPDTLNVNFSCTKGVGSVLVAMLIERGLLPSYDTPIIEVWPAFGAHGKDRMTIGDVLAHRAGVSAPRQALSRAEALDPYATADIIAGQAPLWYPGAAHQYHAITQGALAAKLVRLATGHRIGEVLRDIVADPLRADYWIGLPPSQGQRVAVLSADPAEESPLSDPEQQRWLDRAVDLGGAIELSPAFFNDPAVHRAELPGANGISTADALARIWSATVVVTDGVRLLHDETVEALRMRRSEGVPRFSDGIGPFQAWGAGVMVPSDWQRYLSPASFGHDGAGGQIAFADPVAKVGFAYLRSRMSEQGIGAPIVEALAKALG
jgi:CubicO group peptidase (beta-lactamase class C family)